MRAATHIYHLAEASNWASIQALGLLSASRLETVIGKPGEPLPSAEASHRNTDLMLQGGIRIRDQRPMPPAALHGCLIGMDPCEWYALLNSKVFFWFDIARLNRHRRAFLARPQIVIKIRLAALLEAYLDRCAVTPFNTGNARRKPALRSHATFVPYREWLANGWSSEAVSLGTRERSRSHQPVELAITDAVPDIMKFAESTMALKPHELYAI